MVRSSRGARATGPFVDSSKDTDDPTNRIGNSLGAAGYQIIDMPPLPLEALEHLATLPKDPYYTERWCEFSRFILSRARARAVRRLAHRPFMQAKAYNRKVGSIARYFEPIACVDPTAQFRTLAEVLERDRVQVTEEHVR